MPRQLTYTKYTDVDGVSTVYEATQSDPHKKSGGRAYMCDVCGRVYREDQIIFWRGRVYCTVGSQCYKDIPGILLFENRERYRPVPRPGETERDSPILIEGGSGTLASFSALSTLGGAAMVTRGGAFIMITGPTA